MGATEITRELLGHLVWERNYLQEEKEVLLRERECLLKHDLDGILDCLKAKETLLVKGRILRASRDALRERLRGWAGEQESPFEKILQEAQEEERRRLLESKTELQRLVGEIEGLSDGNRYLIRSALGRIEGCISAIVGSRGHNNPEYTSGGDLQRGPREATLISREA